MPDVRRTTVDGRVFILIMMDDMDEGHCLCEADARELITNLTQALEED